jgi:hypothetical protein
MSQMKVRVVDHNAIKVRVADQNAIKVVGSLTNFKSFNDLEGIDTSGSINNSFLRYNSSTGKWVVTNEIDGQINPRIKIKRSTSTNTSPSLQYGEFGINLGIGTAGNVGGRLFIGDNSGNSVQVGGEYYVSILDHEPGILTPNSALIVDANNHIDSFHVGIQTVDTRITLTGDLYTTGIGTFVNGLVAGGIGISSNIISSKPGYGDVLYIDPNPSGLDAGGTVIIKGNLQVDGESSIINSTTLSTNEIIIDIGEPTSLRTVKGNVAIGSTIIPLDSVVGINTGDIVSNVYGLPVSNQDRTILNYNKISKTISIAGVTTAGITSSTEMLITHVYDTNTDRGISFNYNNSSIGVGLTANRKGYFGFVDSTKKWAYIPDASIVNGVVSGEKGYLDIKGIYYQPSDINQYGITYFDSDGFLNNTGSPGTGISSSNYILTTQLGTNVPVWTDSLDGGGY